MTSHIAFTELDLIARDSIKCDNTGLKNVMTLKVLAESHPQAGQTIILPDFHHQTVLALLQVVLTDFP